MTQSSFDNVISEMMISHKDNLPLTAVLSTALLLLSNYQLYGYTAAVASDEPCCGFLWSIFSSCLKRLSGFLTHSSARSLSASPHLLLLLRAVPKWLCLPLFCLHLLPRLVVRIHLSLSLPVFFCHHHLLASLFSSTKHFSLGLTACPSEPECPAFHQVCSSYFNLLYICIPLWNELLCIPVTLKWIQRTLILNMQQACLLTYLWGEMPEPWSLDEVNSIRLETFYRPLQDLHNWWVYDEWLHLRQSPRLTPETVKPHRNPSIEAVIPSSTNTGLFIHCLHCNQMHMLVTLCAQIHLYNLHTNVKKRG